MYLPNKHFTGASDLIMGDLDRGRNEADYFQFYKEMVSEVCTYIHGEVLGRSEVTFVVEFARLWRCFSGFTHKVSNVFQYL